MGLDLQYNGIEYLALFNLFESVCKWNGIECIQNGTECNWNGMQREWNATRYIHIVGLGFQGPVADCAVVLLRHTALVLSDDVGIRVRNSPHPVLRAGGVWEPLVRQIGRWPVGGVFPVGQAPVVHN